VSVKPIRPTPEAASHLFGRDQDIEAIAASMAGGRDVALVAPPGMGKTTVALEVLRQFSASGWLTAWVPAAMTASAADLTEVLISQVAIGSRRSSHDDLLAITDEIAGDTGDVQHRLGLALEGFVRSAELLGVRAVLVIDDFDVLFEGGRSPDVGQLFTRKLRSVRQRSGELSLLFLMRSDATLRDVFSDPSAPLFASAMTHRLGPLSALASEDLVEQRVREAGARLPEAAISQLTTSCRGMPLYLNLMADAAAASANVDDPTVDFPGAEVALAKALDESAQATEERIELIRRSHRLGLEVARRLATGISPYAGEKSPNNITRALKNLERLGFVHRPAAREWALTDPFLEEVLRSFDPQAIAVRTSSKVGRLPSTPPSPKRAVSRLRGSDVWGIRQDWFEPATVIRDAVCGDIRLTRLERAIADTREFQRLRRIRHMGAANLVYPGATHSSMAHSFGVLAASASLLEAAIQRRGSAWGTAVEDLPDGQVDWAEALALARIGGLVHELATVPFGSTLESELGSRLVAYPARLEHRWVNLVAELADAGLTESEARVLTDGRFYEAMWHVFADAKDVDGSAYRFVHDLLHGPLSANSLDGAARGRHALGLPSSAYGQMISATHLVSVDNRETGGLRLAVDGSDRADVRTALMGHFLSLTRHREARGHPSTRAADAMLAGCVHHWVEALQEKEGGDPVRAALLAEDRLLTISDDGLIDYLVDFSTAAGVRSLEAEDSSAPIAALRRLVDGLARRRLYELAASTRGSTIFACQFFSEYGSADQRRSLERRAAQIADIAMPGQILLSIPKPPRPIFGEVLVTRDDQVAPIHRGRNSLSVEVEKLDDLSARMWCVDVFVDPDLPAKQRKLALDWLASQMRLRWEWTSRDDG
jgi:HD superfamily phosphohydrolase